MDVLSRVWADLMGRLTGPMTFRLYLQPGMAVFFAIRDGLADARAGRPPYLWSFVTHPEERGRLLREGWKATARIIVLALVMDVVYQLIVFRWIYTFEAIYVTMVLAIFPYCLVRGPVTRIAGWWMGR